jgi:Leucine-rich repeat (LRR) protein
VTLLCIVIYTQVLITSQTSENTHGCTGTIKCPQTPIDHCRCNKFDHYYDFYVSCNIEYLANETNFGKYFDNINCTRVKLHFTCQENKTSYLNGSAIQNLLPETVQNLGLEIQNCTLPILKEEYFKGMDKLRFLTIDNCATEYIDKAAFSAVPNLNHANFSRNHLQGEYSKYVIWPDSLSVLTVMKNSRSVFGPHILHDLHNIDQLLLADNNMSDIPQGISQKADNLTTLDLQQNVITHIQQSFFEGLTSVRSLELNNNSIVSIEKSSFAAMPKLKSLNLKFNNLTSISPESLIGLGNLSILTLSYNDITNLSKSNFEAAPGLAKLFLANNSLEEVNMDSFHGLSQLEILQLEDNNIKTIHKGKQISLGNTHILRLSNNFLLDIPGGFFEDFPHVLWLNLEANNFTRVSVPMLQGLHITIFLHLGFCAIEDIEDYSFKRMSYLVYLNLPHNALRRIRRYTFYGLSTLQGLILNKNQISNIEKDSFANMIFLRHVDLRYNRMKAIHSTIFPSSSYHLQIQLNNNTIDVIDDYAFDHIPMVTVDFRENNLHVVNKTIFTYRGKQLENVHRSFKLGQNHLECTCDMRWLLKPTYRFTIPQAKFLSCKTKILFKPKWKRVKLGYLKPEEFYCTVGSICLKHISKCTLKCCTETLSSDCPRQCYWPCPESCNCYSNKYDQHLTQALECYSDMSNQPSKLPFPIPASVDVALVTHYKIPSLEASYFQPGSVLVKLSLPSNGIHNIPCEAFTNTPSLEYLNLEDNYLHTIRKCMFKPLLELKWLFLKRTRLQQIFDGSFATLTNLRSLHLETNLLNQIDYHSLSLGHEKLTELNLAGNRWYCDCNFGSGFRNWVDLNQKYMVNHSAGQMMCSDVMLDTNVHCRRPYLLACNFEKCLDHWMLIIVIGSSSGSVVLVLLLLLCLYCNREILRVFLYYHFNIRLKKTKELEGKVYDAFISFSSEDGCKIMKDILRVLEHGTPPQYKVCIEARDVRIGVDKADALIQAIQTSRRVILILTDQFVANPW